MTRLFPYLWLFLLLLYFSQKYIFVGPTAVTAYIGLKGTRKNADGFTKNIAAYECCNSSREALVGVTTRWANDPELHNLLGHSKIRHQTLSHPALPVGKRRLGCV